jgi:putative DNA primase/helicase
MLRSITDIVPVNIDGIPNYLKNLARWVLWKPLPDEDDPGVLDKTPFECRVTDSLASSTRPETWADFSAAAAAYAAREANGAGGIMIALGEGLAGVDLDDAIDPATGRPTPEAQQIIDRFASYAEVSVSGTGVRIFVQAPEAPGKKFGPVEIYSRARFLTVTGRQIPGTPSTIEDRSAEAAALRDELEQIRQAGRPAVTHVRLDVTRLREMFPGVTVLGVPDSEILMRASEACGERFDKLWSGDDTGYESRSQADLALAGDLAFICGPGEEERVEELMRQSGLDRPKWDRHDYLPQRTIPRAYEGRMTFYDWEVVPGIAARHARPLVVTASAAEAEPATSELSVVELSAPPSPDESSNGSVCTWITRPTIVLGPETDAILVALERHLAPLVFQRAGQLVQINDQDGTGGDERCRRRAGSSVITPTTVEQVQRLMSRHIRFVTPGASEEDRTGDHAEGEEAGGGRASGRQSRRRRRQQQAAPKNLAQLFAKCGQWEHIPHLKGLAASPYLRTDGVVVSTPGYDPVSGYYLVDTGVGWERVPDSPTAEDVQRAVRLLLDLVADFPFAGPQHLSAWVATLLAVAARPAIDGPVPMLWVDANRRGTGKSKLGRLIGIITGGRTPTELSWTPDEKEMENRLTALLGGGDNLAVFDNAAATIRNPVLERFLTCSEFDSRRFHRQELMKLPNRTTLVLNGNNLQLKGDLGRRVIRCRLETSMETPESRDGFRHADIEVYAAANQPSLLAAALTILRAHAAAGFAACPVQVTGEDGTVTEMPARSVGSYDEWDRVVRHAVLRAGLADPVVTQDEVTEEDEDDTKLRTLLRAWHLASRNQPWTGTRLLAEVFGHDGCGESVPGREELAAALREITDTAPGKVPDPRTLGYRLKDAKDKTLDGYRLRKDSKGNKGVRYFVECQDPACADCQARRVSEGAA